jgi:RNA polymerase sigma-70 factor (ECF subfamily)
LREAVLLFYFEQRSYADMADLLGVTEAAINQRLTRARQRLREHLVVAHGGDA